MHITIFYSFVIVILETTQITSTFTSNFTLGPRKSQAWSFFLRVMQRQVKLSFSHRYSLMVETKIYKQLTTFKKMYLLSFRQWNTHSKLASMGSEKVTLRKQMVLRSDLSLSLIALLQAKYMNTTQARLTRPISIMCSTTSSIFSRKLQKRKVRTVMSTLTSPLVEGRGQPKLAGLSMRSTTKMLNSMDIAIRVTEFTGFQASRSPTFIILVSILCIILGYSLYSQFIIAIYFNFTQRTQCPVTSAQLNIQCAIENVAKPKQTISQQSQPNCCTYKKYVKKRLSMGVMVIFINPKLVICKNGNIFNIKQYMRKLTTPIIGQVTQEILAKMEEKISERQFIKGNMNLYSSNRMISLVNQLGGQLLTLPHEQRVLDQEPQPINLAVDTLMPLMNVEPNQQPHQPTEKGKVQSEHQSTSRSYKKLRTLHPKNNHKPSETEEHKKDKKEEKKEQNLHKLAMLQEKEQQQIGQIRREKERELNQERERINKKIESSKKIKLAKQGFNFDYNGNVIQIKSEKKTNLVSKVVMPKFPHQETKKSVQKLPQANATFVKTHQVGKQAEEKGKRVSKYKEADQVKKEEKPQILFSKIKNPIENIDVKQGVKAVFNQSTLQKQRKRLTDDELKQSRSNRKLSKNQYARIKTTTLRSKPQTPEQHLNMESIEPIVHESNGLKRNHPETFTTNIKKRAITEFEPEKIKVADTVLRRELIERARDAEEPKEIERNVDRPLSQVKKKEQLTNMDRYNLNYSRNKTQYSAMKKMSDHEAVLPKIHLKTLNNYPKVRQKLKEASLIRRQVGKKFQQTLRI